MILVIASRLRRLAMTLNRGEPVLAIISAKPVIHRGRSAPLRNPPGAPGKSSPATRWTLGIQGSANLRLNSEKIPDTDPTFRTFAWLSRHLERNERFFSNPTDTNGTWRIWPGRRIVSGGEALQPSVKCLWADVVGGGEEMRATIGTSRGKRTWRSKTNRRLWCPHFRHADCYVWPTGKIYSVFISTHPHPGWKTRVRSRASRKSSGPWSIQHERKKIRWTSSHRGRFCRFAVTFGDAISGWINLSVMLQIRFKVAG